MNLFPKRSRLGIMVCELTVIFAALLIALPASLAVFPQVRDHAVDFAAAVTHFFADTSVEDF